MTANGRGGNARSASRLQQRIVVPIRHRSGDDVGHHLVLQEGDLVLEAQLGPLETGELELVAERFGDERGQPLVGFAYLQTTGDGHPARLDVPAWVYEDGVLDELVDAVRAECVVGNGYPYPLETADAAAGITAQDRAQFLHLVQEFAESAGLSLRLSRKALSKAHRR